MSKSPTPPACPYCDKKCNLADSMAVYRKNYGMIWHCAECNAWKPCRSITKMQSIEEALAEHYVIRDVMCEAINVCKQIHLRTIKQEAEL